MALCDTSKKRHTKEVDMQNAQVYKANALIEASYRLSLYEQRIILGCIAQVRRDEPLTDQQLYTVSAQQIADLTGTQLGTTYQNLKAAVERLFRREVTLHEAPNGKGGAKVRLTRWVQEVVYQEDQGTVALRFSQPMIPYLSQLTEQFTRYALADVAQMTSVHAIRLYELLSQWRGTGEREVELSWFREALLLEDRYSNIRDLKRRVIEPAIEQINEHSPLWVKWDQRKTGRRVSHLVFTFGEKAQDKAHKAREASTRTKTQKTASKSSGSIYGIPQSVIEAKAKPGESYHEAALRLHEASQQRA